MACAMRARETSIRNSLDISIPFCRQWLFWQVWVRFVHLIEIEVFDLPRVGVAMRPNLPPRAERCQGLEFVEHASTAALRSNSKEHAKVGSSPDQETTSAPGIDVALTTTIDRRYRC